MARSANATEPSPAPCYRVAEDAAHPGEWVVWWCPGDGVAIPSARFYGRFAEGRALEWATPAINAPASSTP